MQDTPETQQLRIEREYEELIDLMPVGVGFADMTGELLYFNQSMLDPGGWSPEDISKIGNVAGLYFDPGERDKVMRIFKIENKVDDYEVRFKKKDGGFYYTLMSLRKVLFRNKDAVMAIVQDISEIKSEEEKSESNVKELEDTKLAMLNLLEDLEQEKNIIEDKERRDEIIFLSMGSGLIVTDAKGIIVSVNKAFEDLTGYSSKEIVGRKMTEVLPKYDEEEKLIPESERSITKVLEGKAENLSISSVSKPHYYLRRDGSKLYISGTVSPILINKKITGAVQLFRDISKEREVDKMKTEFISLASHQLRTPLSGMKWFLEMLTAGDAGKLTAEQMEYVKSISESNQRMIDLVNSLLNISRIDSGRLIIEPKISKLKDLVGIALVNLKSRTDSKKIKVNLSVDEKVPEISVDPKLITEVYSNLISNAIKYSPEGSEINISIKLDGDNIISSVSDKGIGIPPGDMEKMFGKFYRSQTASKLDPEGNGLGLYLVKAIVDASGGKVWVESKEGQGSTFFVSLPISGSNPKEGVVTLS